MAQGRRKDRMEELLRIELAGIILNELKDPRLGFLTVVGVEVSPDMKYAKVMVSVMGKEKEKKSSIIALNHAKGYLQSLIGDRLKLRFTPRLTFKLDESLDHSLRIAEVLKKIEEEKEPS